MQAVPFIYEDGIDRSTSSPTKTKKHSRVPSVGNVLRGRKEMQDAARRGRESSPLAERHINSPPKPRQVPTQTNDARPSMHKKSTSSVSIGNYLKQNQKDENNETMPVYATEETARKPKKTKSVSNFATLLRKKSKKDLKEDGCSDKKNHGPIEPAKTPQTPIWAQFASQPIQGSDGRLLSPDLGYTLMESEKRPGVSPEQPPLEHKSSRSSVFTENMGEEEKSLPEPATRASRVMHIMNTLTLKTRQNQSGSTHVSQDTKQSLSPQQLDSELERVLDSMNIPQNLRDGVRNLKSDVKVGLIKGDRSGSGSSATSFPSETLQRGSNSQHSTKGTEERPLSPDGNKEGKRSRSRSRSRPRSRILSVGRKEGRSGKAEATESIVASPTKSRPKSMDIGTGRPASSRSLTSSTSVTSVATPESAVSPGDFIHYLQEVQKPELIEIGKMHKLRILLRNESVVWTDRFVTKGGMDELVQLLYRITKVEWREEHEDTLLHETLLCLKALCTTSLALERLEKIEVELFTTLLAMLFDEERKGPSEFSTRSITISLLFAHLSAKVQAPPKDLETRARQTLSFLKDPSPEKDKQPLGFISQMHISRPYRVWCREVTNVTKEVFWIFLHNTNVVPIIEKAHADDASCFTRAHFPTARPPHPAAPYVGGVEWEATQYLANHLDLLNGVIASLPDQNERNALREDLKQSGWEKVMGGTMRTCKEKFYGGVHDGLKVWVAAAKADGWPLEDVRAGPTRETLSPRKSPVKKKGDEAPRLALDVGESSFPQLDDNWL